MTQIHPVTRLGDREQDLPVEAAFSLDLAEEKDPADAHKRHAEGIVEPRPLPKCGKADRAFHRKDAVTICPDPAEEARRAKRESGEENGYGDGERLLPGQFAHELAEIQPQQQVAYKAADIVEDPVSVPAGLAPKRISGRIRNAGRAVDDGGRAAHPLPDQRNHRGKQPDSQIDLQLLLPHLLGPRRKERHHEVHADKHIDKPHMPCRIIEVQEQVFEVLHGLSPDEGIDHAPEYKRDQDPDGPPAEKLSGGIVQRELQIAGGDDEQGDTGARQHVQDSHPDGIGPGQDQRTFASQIEGLATVCHHDQEAGGDPQPVDPYLAFVLHKSPLYPFQRY